MSDEVPGGKPTTMRPGRDGIGIRPCETRKSRKRGGARCQLKKISDGEVSWRLPSLSFRFDRFQQNTRLDKAAEGASLSAQIRRRQNVGIDDVDRMAGLIGGDLIEDFHELRFVFLARHVTDVRRGNDIGQGQERVVGVAHRLLFKDIDRGHPRAPGLERGDQRPRLDQRRAAGVDDHGRWLHPREIGGGDDAARGVDQTHVQRQHVGLFEKRLLAGGRSIAFGARLRHRRLARPELYRHAEGFAVFGHRAADPAVAENSERLAAQRRTDADLPGPGLERGHLLRNLPHRGQRQAPRQFRGGVARRAGMLAGGHDDAEIGAGADVDVRIDAALADEFEPREPFEQRCADFRALADQHQRVRILEPVGQDVDVLDVVVPDLDLVAVKFAKTVEGADRVEVVVEDRDLHKPHLPIFNWS